MAHRVARALVIGALVLALAATGGGLATLTLFSSWGVSALTQYTHGTSVPTSVGTLAEETRRYTVGVSSQLPVDPAGVEGYDESAIAHLLDVRSVVRAVTAASIVFGCISLVSLAVLLAQRRMRVLSLVLRWAGVLISAAVLIVGVVVLTGFERFFVGFHGLFFEPGTWQFASDSLLITTFPETFWVAAAVAWLGVVMVYATALVLGSLWAGRPAQSPAQ